MNFLFKIFLITLVGIPIVSNASDIKFSGFATIAGGITSDDNEHLEGYDNELNFSPNSLFAVQASKDLEDGWGAAIQLLASGEKDWDVNTEWAYLSYRASDNWKLLFGRQRAAMYMFSDYLNVSYAYHWITPPSGVYNSPHDVFDGIGSVYTSTIGDFDSTFTATYGRTKEKINMRKKEIQTFEIFLVLHGL